MTPNLNLGFTQLIGSQINSRKLEAIFILLMPNLQRLHTSNPIFKYLTTSFKVKWDNNIKESLNGSVEKEKKKRRREFVK